MSFVPFPFFIETLQDKVVTAYREVLASLPQPCPVELWTDMIMGPQADFEYHLFKKWGFDVPLSAQRAFFTMMMGPRSSYLKNNEDLARVQSIINLARGKGTTTPDACLSEGALVYMERALFIAKSKNLKYFSPQLTRIYFGTEFCQRLFPSKHEIDRVIAFVQENNCALTLVTPYVTNEGLQNWRAVIEQVAAKDPHCEVVFNDWGLFRILRDISPELKPVLGRLMTKIKRGPRLMKVMDKLPPDALKHLQSTNLSVEPYRTFLLDRGIVRAELDHPLQDMQLNGIGSSLHLSLYIPFVYVTTTRFCLSASCDKPEEKGMVGILPCKKECQKYTFSLDNPVMEISLIRKGNTIFFKNDKIPKGDELREKKIDRLVIQPEIPI